MILNKMIQSTIPKWEDYIQQCFKLSGSVEAQSFIRSTFDYSIRQRRAVRGYSRYPVNVYLEFWELKNFQRFWSDLNEGTNTWYTDNIIHGDNTLGKTVRFTEGYKLSEVGKGIHLMTCGIELIRTGTDKDDICPATPYPFSIPKDDVPC